MSTRSFIIIPGDEPEKGYKAIYVHSDGYPEGVGYKLLSYYTGWDKIKELVALGDVSILGSDIGQKHDLNLRFKTLSRNEAWATWTAAYHRDRGDDWVLCAPVVSESLEDVVLSGVKANAEHLYLYDKERSRWMWMDVEKLFESGAVIVDSNARPGNIGNYVRTEAHLPEWDNLKGYLERQAMEGLDEKY